MKRALSWLSLVVVVTAVWTLSQLVFSLGERQGEAQTLKRLGWIKARNYEAAAR